jgi:hypothetical protein
VVTRNSAKGSIISNIVESHSAPQREYFASFLTLETQLGLAELMFLVLFLKRTIGLGVVVLHFKM